MSELTKWAQDNSPFLKIPDNDAVDGIYRGYKIVDDERNPGQTKVRYIIEVYGKNKWFESRATRVALLFDSIAEGDQVTIAKQVDRNKTRYDVWKTKDGSEEPPFINQQEEEMINEKEMSTSSKKITSRK